MSTIRFFFLDLGDGFTKGISWDVLKKFIGQLRLPPPGHPAAAQIMKDAGIFTRVYTMFYERPELYWQCIMAYVDMRMATRAIGQDTRQWYENQVDIVSKIIRSVERERDGLKAQINAGIALERALENETAPTGKLLTDTELDRHRLEQAFVKARILKIKNAKLSQLLGQAKGHNQLLLQNEARVIKEVEMAKKGTTRPFSMAALEGYRLLIARVNQLERAINTLASDEDSMDPVRLELAAALRTLIRERRQNNKHNMVMHDMLVDQTGLRATITQLQKTVSELTQKLERNRANRDKWQDAAENLKRDKQAIECKYKGAIESAKAYKELYEAIGDAKLQKLKKAMTTQIEQKSREIECLKSTQAQKDDQHAANLKIFSDNLQRSDNQNDQLRNDIEELQRANRNLKGKYQKVEANCKDHKMEIQNLQSENEALIKQVQQYQTAEIMRQGSQPTSVKPQSTNVSPSDGSIVVEGGAGDHIRTASLADNCDGTDDRSPPSEPEDDPHIDGPNVKRSEVELLARADELEYQLEAQRCEIEALRASKYEELQAKDEEYQEQIRALHNDQNEEIHNISVRKFKLQDQRDALSSRTDELHKGRGDSASNAELASDSPKDVSHLQLVQRDMFLSRIEELRDQVDELRREMEELRAAKDEQIHTITTRCRALEQEENEQYMRFLRKDYQLVLHENEVKGLKSHLEHMEDQNGRLRVRAERAERDAGSGFTDCRSNQHVAKLYTEFYRQLEQERTHGTVPTLELAVLRDQLFKMQTHLGAVEKERDSNRKKLDENRHQLRQHMAQIESLRAAVDEAEDERNQQHLTGDDDELQELKETVSHNERKSKLDNSRVIELEKELHSLKAMVSQRDAVNANLNAKNAEFTAKRNDLEQQIEALKSECNAAQEWAQRLLQEKEAVKAECQNAQRAAMEFRSENLMMREERKRISSLSVMRKDSCDAMSDDLRSPSLRPHPLQRQGSVRHRSHRDSLSSAIDGLTPDSPGGTYFSSPKVSSPPPDLSNPRLSIGGMSQRHRPVPLGSSMSRMTSRIGRSEYHDNRSPRPLLLGSMLEGQRSSSMPSPATFGPTVQAKSAPEQKEASDKTPTQSSRTELKKTVSEGRSETTQVIASKAIDNPAGVIKSDTLATLRERVVSDSSLFGVFKLCASTSLANLAENPFIKADNAALSRVTPVSSTGKDRNPSGESLARAALGNISQNFVQSRAQEFLSPAQGRSASDPESSLTASNRFRAVSEDARKPQDNPTTSFSTSLRAAAEVPELGKASDSEFSVRSPPSSSGEPTALSSKKLRPDPIDTRLPIAVNDKRVASFALKSAPAKPSPLSNSFNYPPTSEFPVPESAEPKEGGPGVSKQGKFDVSATHTNPTRKDTSNHNFTTNPIVHTPKSPISRLPKEASGIPVPKAIRAASDSTPTGASSNSGFPRPASRTTPRLNSLPKQLASTSTARRTLTPPLGDPFKEVKSVNSPVMDDPFGNKVRSPPTKRSASDEDIPSSPPVNLRKISQNSQKSQQSQPWRTVHDVPVMASKRGNVQFKHNRKVRSPKNKASSGNLRGDATRSVTPNMLERSRDFSFGNGSNSKTLRGGVGGDGVVSPPSDHLINKAQNKKNPRLKIPYTEDFEPKGDEDADPNGKDNAEKTSKTIEAPIGQQGSSSASGPARSAPVRAGSDIGTLPSQIISQQAQQSAVEISCMSAMRSTSGPATTGGSGHKVNFEPQPLYVDANPAPVGFSDTKPKVVPSKHLAERLNKVAAMTDKYTKLSLETESSGSYPSGPNGARTVSSEGSMRTASNQSVKSGPSDTIRQRQQTLVAYGAGYIPGHNAMPYHGADEDSQRRSPSGFGSIPRSTAMPYQRIQEGGPERSFSGSGSIPGHTTIPYQRTKEEAPGRNFSGSHLNPRHTAMPYQRTMENDPGRSLSVSSDIPGQTPLQSQGIKEDSKRSFPGHPSIPDYSMIMPYQGGGQKMVPERSLSGSEYSSGNETMPYQPYQGSKEKGPGNSSDGADAISGRNAMPYQGAEEMDPDRSFIGSDDDDFKPISDTLEEFPPRAASGNDYLPYKQHATSYEHRKTNQGFDAEAVGRTNSEKSQGSTISSISVINDLREKDPKAAIEVLRESGPGQFTFHSPPDKIKVPSRGSSLIEPFNQSSEEDLRRHIELDKEYAFNRSFIGRVKNSPLFTGELFGIKKKTSLTLIPKPEKSLIIDTGKARQGSWGSKAINQIRKKSSRVFSKEKSSPSPLGMPSPYYAQATPRMKSSPRVKSPRHFSLVTPKAKNFPRIHRSSPTPRRLKDDQGYPLEQETPTRQNAGSAGPGKYSFHHRESPGKLMPRAFSPPAAKHRRRLSQRSASLNLNESITSEFSRAPTLSDASRPSFDVAKIVAQVQAENSRGRKSPSQKSWMEGDDSFMFEAKEMVKDATFREEVTRKVARSPTASEDRDKSFLHVDTDRESTDSLAEEVAKFVSARRIGGYGGLGLTLNEGKEVDPAKVQVPHPDDRFSYTSYLTRTTADGSKLSMDRSQDLSKTSDLLEGHDNMDDFSHRSQDLSKTSDLLEGRGYVDDYTPDKAHKVLAKYFEKNVQPWEQEPATPKQLTFAEQRAKRRAEESLMTEEELHNLPESRVRERKADLLRAKQKQEQEERDAKYAVWKQAHTPEQEHFDKLREQNFEKDRQEQLAARYRRDDIKFLEQQQDALDKRMEEAEFQKKKNIAWNKADDARREKERKEYEKQKRNEALKKKLKPVKRIFSGDKGDRA